MIKRCRALIGLFLIFFYFSSVKALEKPEVFIPEENSKLLLDEFSFVSGKFTDYLIVYSPENNGIYFIWDVTSSYVESIPSEALKKDNKILENFLFYLKGLNYTKKKFDNNLNIDISNEPQHSKDGKLTAKIIPYQGKQIISLVRTSDNKELAKLFIFKNREWIILTPAGYYSASDFAGKYLNVKIGDKVYKMENFEKVFYRPEIVEAALEGNAISELKFPIIKLPDIKKEKKYNIIIEEASSDFPFEKAGGKIWDIIYSLNGKIFYKSSNKDLTKEFSNYIKSLTAGSYEMTLIREGKKITTTINLPETSSTPRMGITFSAIENNPQFYFNEALELLKNAKSRNDLKIVAQLLEIAKALSPQWADVYYNLGLVYEELTYYDKAAENFSKYVDFVKDKNSVEAKNMTFRIEENRKKYEKLEYIKKRMVEGELVVASGQPPYLVPPIFKLDKSNKVVMLNPYTDYMKRLKKSGWEGRKHPWELHDVNSSKLPFFHVKFEGKYFEVRYFTIEQAGNKLNVLLNLTKGELDLNSLRIKTINLSYNYIEQYNSIEEAIKEASYKISSFNFDEINDTRTKVFHIGINEVYKIWKSPVVIYIIK
jgi:tetratricopeptide (TPR) repeat protein